MSLLRIKRENHTRRNLPILSAVTMITRSPFSRINAGWVDTRRPQVKRLCMSWVAAFGEPILDGSENVIGLATSKLNAIRAARMKGDIPQNVTFSLQTDIVIIFLDSINIGYNTNEQIKTI